MLKYKQTVKVKKKRKDPRIKPLITNYSNINQFLKDLSCVVPFERIIRIILEKTTCIDFETPMHNSQMRITWFQLYKMRQYPQMYYTNMEKLICLMNSYYFKEYNIKKNVPMWGHFIKQLKTEDLDHFPEEGDLVNFSCALILLNEDLLNSSDRYLKYSLELFNRVSKDSKLFKLSKVFIILIEALDLLYDNDVISYDLLFTQIQECMLFDF